MRNACLSYLIALELEDQDCGPEKIIEVATLLV